MKLRIAWIALALPLCLLACDGEDPEDGGVDAGAGPEDAGLSDAGPIDAGLDAGPLDAGPVDAGPGDAGSDAGPSDAGPPTPVLVAMEVMAARTALDSAVDDVPVEMRVDGAFSNLDIGAAGLDALIGEDGLETLALSDATVRALADVHTANIIIDRLDSAIAALDGRPSVAAVRTQTLALRDRTTDYRDALALVYQTRLAAGIVGSPVVEAAHISNFLTLANSTASRLLVVIEGATAGDANASFQVECFPSEGTVDFTLDVRAVETGTSIASTSGSDSATLMVPAAFDEVTAVEVEFQADTPSTMGFTEQCGLSVTSRRRLRLAPVDVPTVDVDFSMAFDAYSMAVLNAEDEILALENSEDPGLDLSVLAAAGDAIMLYRNLVAALVASDLLPIPVEHYQRIARQAVYVRAMIDALLASDPFAPALYSDLRADIASAMTQAEAMIAVVAAL
ncbi:MAG: hypothetical protein AB8I08_02405 [Sandaracinaceae bacterium]